MNSSASYSGRLLRSLTDQHRHLTEDVSIYQNEQSQGHEHDKDLSIRPWSHFVTSEGQHTQVEHCKELVCLSDLLCVIETVILASLHVDEIKWGCPNLFNTDDKEPEASQNVKDENEREKQLEDLKRLYWKENKKEDETVKKAIKLGTSERDLRLCPLHLTPVFPQKE